MSKESLDSQPVLLLFGDLPPPTTGAAKNNAKMAAILETVARVVLTNTSGGSIGLRRTFGYHFRRLLRNCIGMGRLVTYCLHSSKYVYHVPNAGLGSIYTFAIVLVGSVCRYRFIFHHRGFTYIDRPSAIMTAVVALTGTRSTHVFLSDRMRQAYLANYRVEGESLVVSNVSLLDFDICGDGHGDAREEGATDSLLLGHLSNLCEEKGFLTVCATFEKMLRAGVAVRLALAGPFVSEGCKREYESLKKRYGNLIEWRGPLYDLEKRSFYMDVDVFLFPTVYKVEAEPNVVLEALATGCVIAATDRGCIPGLVPASGLVCEAGTDFTHAASNWLQELIAGEQLQQSKLDSVEHILALLERSKGEMGKLLGRIGQNT